MATFHFGPLVRSACPINPWLARFACVALRKVVPKLDPSPRKYAIRTRFLEHSGVKYSNLIGQLGALHILLVPGKFPEHYSAPFLRFP